jgi:hypothetical protein
MSSHHPCVLFQVARQDSGNAGALAEDASAAASHLITRIRTFIPEESVREFCDWKILGKTQMEEKRAA